jgi:short-subunit dehydrogenase
VRTAVITGGSSGIGLAVARILARRGGWQIVLAARREEPLAVAAAELGAVAVRCDVTVDADVAGLVAEAADLGGCDLLVHAAGAPARARVLEAELASYRAALEVNYIGLVRVGTAFWPLLETARGRFVPVISIAGAVALAPAGPYGASKAAALSWARSYGAAAREHGVALTIVNPGPVTTTGFPQTALLRSRFGRLIVIDAEHCAERLLAAADRRSPEVYVPHWWRVAAAFQGAAPGITARVAARAWRHGAYPAPEPEAAPA